MLRPATLIALLLALALAPTAGAAELVTIEVPSAGNVDVARVDNFNGNDHPRTLRANVLLPDGYDGKQRFPVLFLLHGVGDAYDTWMKPNRGDIMNTAKGFPGVVVMPEAARGFYTNWWNDGRRGDPGWERYYLDELIPLVEKRFLIRPGRRWHAIAGLSMGGLGSTYVASQRPDYFGSAATFSGFVAHQRPETEAGLTAVGNVSYEKIFGPQQGFYASGHSPAKLTDNLRHTRLYVTVGDGTPEPGVMSEPAAIVGGGAVEAGLRPQSDELAAAARASGVDTTYVPLRGVHDWPYWRRHLREAIAWDFFKPVSERPEQFTYSTVAPVGRMWDLSYRFERAPEGVVRFERTDGTLSARGSSGRVTIANLDGCGFTADLPFERSIPTCPPTRIRLTVSPRSVRLGQLKRFRFTATTVRGGRRVPVRSARVRLGRKTALTNSGGRVVIAYRLSERRSLRTPRVSKRGLLPGRVVIRVRR